MGIGVGIVLIVIGAVLLFAVAPVVLGDFRLGLLAKYLTFAIVAVGIGLAWGRGGMLALGQGVFFGLGGYAMAMHLKLADAGPGQLPDFMVLYGQLDAIARRASASASASTWRAATAGARSTGTRRRRSTRR